MKLKEFNFNELSTMFLSIRYENGKWYTGFIGDVLRKIPREFADYTIKETRWFFNEFVIELEE